MLRSMCCSLCDIVAISFLKMACNLIQYLPLWQQSSSRPSQVHAIFLMPLLVVSEIGLNMCSSLSLACSSPAASPTQGASHISI